MEDGEQEDSQEGKCSACTYRLLTFDLGSLSEIAEELSSPMKKLGNARK